MGDLIPCASDCQAHFDPNYGYDDEYGGEDARDEYPNSVLAWAALLEGSTWVGPDMTESVAVYRNDTLFLDGDGRNVPVWIVILHEGVRDWHFASLFVRPGKASAFVAEFVAENEQGVAW